MALLENIKDKKKKQEQFPCLDCSKIFDNQSDMVDHWKKCKKGKGRC